MNQARILPLFGEGWMEQDLDWSSLRGSVLVRRKPWHGDKVAMTVMPADTPIKKLKSCALPLVSLQLSMRRTLRVQHDRS